MPAAPVTACCSAMPDVEESVGEPEPGTGCSPVGPGIAAVIATTARIGSASLMIASAKACVYPDGIAGGGPIAGIEDRRIVQVLLVVVFRRRVPAALLGEDVHEDRAFGRQLDCVAERSLQLLDVVAVDRADVAHPERLEERRRLEELAHGGLEGLDALLGLRADVRQLAQEVLELALPLHVHRVEADVGEAVRQPLGDPRRQARMVGHRPVEGRRPSREVGDRRRVAAAVVVEDDDDPLAGVADVVQRLVRHAPGHRPVADHGDDVPTCIGAGIAGNRQAVGVRQDGRGVAVLDEVVRALLAAEVAGQAARLAQLIELVLPAGDDLVHVALVPGVPQDRVGR